MAVPSLPPISGGKTLSRAPVDFDLANLDPDALLDLRAEIDQLLPVKHLKDLNMQRELVVQLLTTQRLQNSAMKDDEVPANQKGQIASQVASILGTLGKLQIDVYSSERLKIIEGILIETIKNLPMEQQETFLTAYEKAVGSGP
jgi:hypothetical protein